MGPRAPIKERAEIIRMYLSKPLIAPAQEITRVEVADSGNTIKPMRADVGHAVDSLNSRGIAHELKARHPGNARSPSSSLREPYGVVGRIMPFNHPLMFAVARTAAALASGNAVVVKPPTPALCRRCCSAKSHRRLTSRPLRCRDRAWRTVGDAIIRHPDLKRIAFIGSVETGRAIQRAAAEVCIKHVTSSSAANPDDRVSGQRSGRDRRRRRIRDEFHLAGSILRLDQPAAPAREYSRQLFEALTEQVSRFVSATP